MRQHCRKKSTKLILFHNLLRSYAQTRIISDYRSPYKPDDDGAGVS